jgi:hypothetical protein
MISIKWRKQMQRVMLFVSVVGVSLMLGSVASAASFSGLYTSTREASCINTSGGFNSDFTPTNGTASASSFSVHGTRSFDGKGNGTVTGTSVGTATGQYPNAGSATFSYKFTYTVDSQGDVTTQIVPGSFSGTIHTGPRAGQTFTTSGIPESGHFSSQVKIFTLSPLTPSVETITYSNNDVDYRICNSSEVLVYRGPK